MYRPVSKKVESKVSCKYALSTAVSKRARMLVDLNQCNDEFKPVLQALEELENDELVPHQTNE